MKIINIFVYFLNVFYINGTDTQLTLSTDVFSNFEKELKDLYNKYEKKELSEKEFYSAYSKLYKKYKLLPGEYSDFTAAINVVKNSNSNNKLKSFLEKFKDYLPIGLIILLLIEIFKLLRFIFTREIRQQISTNPTNNYNPTIQAW